MSTEVDDLCKAIKRCKKHKSRFIVRYNKLIIRYITIGYNSNENKYLIQISISPYNCLVDNVTKQTDEGKTTTLSEAIGFENDYKLLFDKLKESTNLSKKEISDLLRHEITLSGNHEYFFTSYISEI